MQSKMQAGDVVFQMPKNSGPAFYILHGTSKMFDSKNKYDNWMATNQGLPMASLIAELGKLDKKELTATHDRYIDLNNPNKEKGDSGLVYFGSEPEEGKVGIATKSCDGCGTA